MGVWTIITVQDFKYHCLIRYFVFAANLIRQADNLYNDHTLANFWKKFPWIRRGESALSPVKLQIFIIFSFSGADDMIYLFDKMYNYEI